MLEIKICGLTSLEDAAAACEAGADAVGFIFHPPSPRCIRPEEARRIVRNLPASVCKVGVFVNHDLKGLQEIAAFCGIDLIQLHGDESPAYCSRLTRSRVIKAVFPRNERALVEAAHYKVRAVLADARTSSKYGGTGLRTDWTLAARLKENFRLILAGGLEPDNADDAVAAVGPDALDFNSGVESAPGRKDPEKMRRAVAAARKAADNRNGFKEPVFIGLKE